MAFAAVSNVCFTCELTVDASHLSSTMCVCHSQHMHDVEKQQTRLGEGFRECFCSNSRVCSCFPLASRQDKPLIYTQSH